MTNDPWHQRQVRHIAADEDSTRNDLKAVSSAWAANQRAKKTGTAGTGKTVQIQCGFHSCDFVLYCAVSQTNPPLLIWNSFSYVLELTNRVFGHSRFLFFKSVSTKLLQQSVFILFFYSQFTASRNVLIVCIIIIIFTTFPQVFCAFCRLNNGKKWLTGDYSSNPAEWRGVAPWWEHPGSFSIL